ncbi:MAG: hypothetical protein HYZ95_00105, partial [Candidatus Omnitrophica bacterium]|nr:hypothetical protein [Candidatus Omnitrophota bacterium]
MKTAKKRRVRPAARKTRAPARRRRPVSAAKPTNTRQPVARPAAKTVVANRLSTELAIFTGTANPVLAKAICAELNVQLSDCLVGRF